LIICIIYCSRNVLAEWRGNTITRE